LKRFLKVGFSRYALSRFFGESSAISLDKMLLRRGALDEIIVLQPTINVIFLMMLGMSYK